MNRPFFVTISDHGYIREEVFWAPSRQAAELAAQKRFPYARVLGVRVRE